VLLKSDAKPDGVSRYSRIEENMEESWTVLYERKQEKGKYKIFKIIPPNSIKGHGEKKQLVEEGVIKDGDDIPKKPKNK
jgi:hypothetical protein